MLRARSSLPATSDHLSLPLARRLGLNSPSPSASGGEVGWGYLHELNLSLSLRGSVGPGPGGVQAAWISLPLAGRVGEGSSECRRAPAISDGASSRCHDLMVKTTSPT